MFVIPAFLCEVSALRHYLRGPVFYYCWFTTALLLNFLFFLVITTNYLLVLVIFPFLIVSLLQRLSAIKIFWFMVTHIFITLILVVNLIQTNGTNENHQTFYVYRKYRKEIMVCLVFSTIQIFTLIVLFLFLK